MNPLLVEQSIKDTLALGVTIVGTHLFLESSKKHIDWTDAISCRTLTSIKMMYTFMPTLKFS